MYSIKVEVCCPMVVLMPSVFSLWRHLCWFGGFTNFPWQLVWWTHTLFINKLSYWKTWKKKQSWVERVQRLARFAKVSCFHTHSVLREASHSVDQKPHAHSTSSISQLATQLRYSAEDASEAAKFSSTVYTGMPFCLRSGQLNTKPPGWFTHKATKASAQQDTPEDNVPMKPFADILLAMFIHIPANYTV